MAMTKRRWQHAAAGVDDDVMAMMVAVVVVVGVDDRTISLFQ